MATKEFWIQLENRPWDACPNNISRMDGLTIEEKPGMAPPVNVNLTSPETGVVRTQKMYLPVSDPVETAKTGKWKVKDALILRRYTENWEAPHDHKVNPWDLNEPDPTDNGTMGTIPGPTIECNVGDKVIVHFRNKDNSATIITIKIPIFTGGIPPKFEFREIKFPIPLPVEERTHSLHPHGIVFPPIYDGAYPLSPPDPSQPVTQAVDDPAKDETALWANVGVSGGFKKGDRVPPGGTFTYIWDTFGWPSTAGVWHYHDHSICDVENVLLGAIGFLVIHNPEDPDDVLEPDDPGGVHGGSPIEIKCFPIGLPIPVLPHDLEEVVTHTAIGTALKVKESVKRQKRTKDKDEPEMADFAVKRGDLILRPDKDLRHFFKICLPFYVTPPQQAQYLQYYHEMPGIGMCINGRRFLGNTPTLIAGPETKMRFGLAAMNNLTFHTFHLHGHRWVIPGPAGNTPGDIQNSPQVQAVSQFEDTKIFGPANSFSLTINQGSFMGSRFTLDPSRAPGVGEWHMHCHVLGHMMPGGMMGSLLVIEGGELAFPSLLPKGVPCPALEPEGEPEEDTAPLEADAIIVGFAFPPSVTVKQGGTVTFINNDSDVHSIVWDTPGAPGNSPIIAAGGGTWPVVMPNVGTFTYHCGVHAGMTPATIEVVS